MINTSNFRGLVSTGWGLGLILITAMSVSLGLYGRLKGLGSWPLGVDEFYMSRSVDNILRTGLPHFVCGGYYTRGLLYQYIVALLRVCGMTPEFSGRVVSAVSSVAMLPAAYLIGRRIRGPLVGLVCVAILSLSIWEIEMARFARMYAPFQAVFAWYVVFFMRYTIDRNRNGLIGMIAMSIVGVLTWEGGALLGIVNLLPPFLNRSDGRLRRKDWLYLTMAISLLFALYASTIDLRGFADRPAIGAAAPAAAAPPQALIFIAYQHLFWLLCFLAPLAFALRSVRWLWSLRQRWIAAVGLSAALISALAHQFVLCAALLMLLPLIRCVEWREIANRQTSDFWLSILASLIFWTSFGLMTNFWHASNIIHSAGADKFIGVAQHLSGFLNVFERIIRPWARTLPILGGAIFVAFAGLTFYTIAGGASANRAVATLLVMTIVLMLSIAASNAPRMETRYTFFLYPILISLTATAVATAVATARVRCTRNMADALTTAGFLLFTLSEDFRPFHILRIDTREVNFRVGMSAAERDHYYPRSDYRGAGAWLDANVRAGDVVISGIPNIDQYYPYTAFFFMDESDERYESYACGKIPVERWSNRRLLFSTDSLSPMVATGRRILLVLYSDPLERVLRAAAYRDWRYQILSTSREGGVKVLILNPGDSAHETSVTPRGPGS